LQSFNKLPKRSRNEFVNKHAICNKTPSRHPTSEYIAKLSNVVLHFEKGNGSEATQGATRDKSTQSKVDKVDCQRSATSAIDKIRWLWSVFLLYATKIPRKIENIRCGASTFLASSDPTKTTHHFLPPPPPPQSNLTTSSPLHRHSTATCNKPSFAMALHPRKKRLLQRCFA
jgi:hypothetical protein